MECGSISRDPASESIANIERVFSLGSLRPKLDFPRSIFGEKSVRGIKYRKTQCFVSIVGCLGLKVSNLYML